MEVETPEATEEVEMEETPMQTPTQTWQQKK
jgi:hypothetical protein